MKPSAILVLAPGALLALASPAAAQTFMTEAEAAGAVLGKDVTLHRQAHVLTPEVRKQLEDSSGLRFPEPSFTFLIADNKREATGYAVVMNEIGKSEPITFMVGMSPEGKVGEVVLMTFRESRGAEVREPRFMRQFRGKTASSPLRVNQDVINYTGATLSSKAIARGVKRALRLLERFYPREKRKEVPLGSVLVEPRLPQAWRRDGGLALFRQARYLMGTRCELRFWTKTPQEADVAFQAGFGEVARLEQVFSNYRDNSELAELNCTAAGGWAETSPDMWRLLRHARRAWRASRGAVDPTVVAGFQYVQLDERRRAVRFANGATALDFGGLAKGYAADRVAAELRALGIGSAAIDLGSSSLRFLGSGWLVATSQPEQLFVARDGDAVSTSGTGERGSHIVDPRTAKPVRGDVSATVFAPTALAAEVASKSLLLNGPARRGAWLLTRDGQASLSGAMRQRIL
jgi:thiamine biosynthesis lipoprotein ApbE/Na+-translocating ferredoxin:NAD+ oxidoreductase RnfG subunit